MMPSGANNTRIHDQPSEYELLSRSASPLPPVGEPSEMSQRIRQPWAKLALTTWMWEILAICFSLLSFLAIVCILLVFNGKARPQFAYGFTLNAIISILATASKSSLIYVIGECIGQLKWIWFYKTKKKKELYDMQLFDSASRGPLGSLSVMLQHKGRSLVSLGALLTVLALMFDPFLQQILTYSTRETVQAADANGAVVAKQALFFLPDSASIDFQGVINTGIWSESADQLEPAVTCSSGNCEWEPFVSVGMCSQCEDITTSTKFECGPLVVNGTANRETTATDCEIRPPQGDGITVRINSTMNPLRAVDGIYYPSLFLDVPVQEVWLPFQREGSEVQNGTEATYAGVRSPQFVIAHAQLALASNDTTGLSPLAYLAQTFRLSKVTQCALALCARTYRVSVSNGTALFDVSAPDFGRVFSTPDLFFTGPDCWMPASPGLSPDSVNLTKLREGYADVSRLAFCPITTYDLRTYLEGHAVMPYLAFNLSKWEPQSDGMTGIFLPQNPAAGKVVSDGLEVVIGNVAASLSRAALRASNYTVFGTGYVSEVYTSVDWIWLLFPAALIALGILFLILTVVTNNKQHRLHPWKSSMLAILFHGLSSLEPELVNNETATEAQMEMKARAIRVRLRTVDHQRGLMLDQS